MKSILNKTDSLVGRIGSSCRVSARSMLTAFICGATTADRIYYTLANYLIG